MKGGYRRTIGGMVGLSAVASAMAFMASKTMGMYERGTANLFKSERVQIERHGRLVVETLIKNPVEAFRG